MAEPRPTRAELVALLDAKLDAGMRSPRAPDGTFDRVLE